VRFRKRKKEDRQLFRSEVQGKGKKRTDSFSAVRFKEKEKRGQTAFPHRGSRKRKKEDRQLFRTEVQ